MWWVCSSESQLWNWSLSHERTDQYNKYFVIQINYIIPTIVQNYTDMTIYQKKITSGMAEEGGLTLAKVLGVRSRTLVQKDLLHFERITKFDALTHTTNFPLSAT